MLSKRVLEKRRQEEAKYGPGGYAASGGRSANQRIQIKRGIKNVVPVTPGTLVKNLSAPKKKLYQHDTSLPVCPFEERYDRDCLDLACWNSEKFYHQNAQRVICHYGASCKGSLRSCPRVHPMLEWAQQRNEKRVFVPEKDDVGTGTDGNKI